MNRKSNWQPVTMTIRANKTLRAISLSVYEYSLCTHFELWIEITEKGNFRACWKHSVHVFTDCAPPKMNSTHRHAYETPFAHFIEQTNILDWGKFVYNKYKQNATRYSFSSKIHFITIQIWIVNCLKKTSLLGISLNAFGNCGFGNLDI